jgi:putative salt-induced outer membrane protein YdiY
MKTVLAILLSLIINSAWADDATTLDTNRHFKGDEEAGAVVVTGNTSAQTYNFKSDTSYTQNNDTFGLIFNYVDTQTFTAESRFWDNTIRYERAISAKFSGYTDEKWESDDRSGFTQRTSTDLGGKYYFSKDDANKIEADFGYRYSDMLQNFAHQYTSNARLYAEWDKSIDKKTSFKLWLEYLPNLSLANSYLLNYEESLSVVLSNLFSLKLAYLTRYQSVVLPGLYNTDTTTTAALVAKF